MQEKLDFKHLQESLLELVSKVPFNGLLVFLKSEIDKINFRNEIQAFSALVAILEKLKFDSNKLMFEQV